MSNILLALMDVDAAVRLARQHMAVQVIVTLVASAVHQFDGCYSGSCLIVVASYQLHLHGRCAIIQMEEAAVGRNHCLRYIGSHFVPHLVILQDI